MAASLDEAYLNITAYVTDNNVDPSEAVTQLRAEIVEKTQITTSAGLAASISYLSHLRITSLDSLLAKIGSNQNKVPLSVVSDAF